MAQETSDGVPISDGFDFPVGPRGDNVDVFKTHKVDSVLVDPAYFKSFGVWHPGEDWNGRRGGDTDLGDPIYAISHGKVVEFGYDATSWGNIVLLEHALPDETRVWSQYAHLDRIMVDKVGQKVMRGQQIGTMGKGAKTAQFPQGRWIAHLHFEIRKTKLSMSNWLPMVRDRNAVLANYINPTPYINARRPAQFAQTVETTVKVPDQIVVDTDGTNADFGSFRRANASNWYSAPYGFNGTMLWTFVSAETEANWGEWRPNLPAAGQWQVWVFVPEQHASTTYARYTVVHADGRTEAAVNQGANKNNWVLLGTFRFNEKGGYVRLTDVTGELSETAPLMIGFDAICWTRAG
jgi:hypothetical protein